MNLRLIILEALLLSEKEGSFCVFCLKRGEQETREAVLPYAQPQKRRNMRREYAVKCVI